jgi:hypothetical protein
VYLAQAAPARKEEIGDYRQLVSGRAAAWRISRLRQCSDEEKLTKAQRVTHYAFWVESDAYYTFHSQLIFAEQRSV